MTNDISIAKSPEEILEEYRQRLSERAKNISAQITAAPSNFIKTKGRVFTFPDGVTNPGPLSCVIIDFVAANAYFEGVYNPTKQVPPVCWALGDADTLISSERSPKRQHSEACATCPQNQWGTAKNGGKGKACKNTMKLALIPSDLEAPDESKLYTINVSPTGIKIFSAYVRRVQKLLGDDALPIRVITELSFDPNQEYPTLRFQEIGPSKNLGVALQMLNTARELLLREPKGDDE